MSDGTTDGTNTFDLVSTQLDKLHELLGNSDDEEEPVASITPRILTGGACYLLRHASVLHCQVVLGSPVPATRLMGCDFSILALESTPVITGIYSQVCRCWYI